LNKKKKKNLKKKIPKKKQKQNRYKIALIGLKYIHRINIDILFAPLWTFLKTTQQDQQIPNLLF